MPHRARRRKQKELIPVDESSKIIYLDARGKEKRAKAPIFFGILGAVCILYCLAIFLFMGYGTKFFLLWGGVGAACLVLALLFRRREWLIDRLPKWFRRAVLGLTLVSLICFLALEGLILSGFGEKPQPGADYVLILGAQWKTSGPSYVLKKRLDAALRYLRDNPEALAVVSGGQGGNEPISEAAGMRRYLMEAGIDGERIFMEDRSTNTCENLKFSAALFDESRDRIVLVTNNFHMFRALGIARKQGYRNVEGLSAPSYPAMLPNNLLREALGVLKDWLVGNL